MTVVLPRAMSRCFAVLFLGLAPAMSASAADASPPPRIAALRFAWPEKLEADVDYTRTRIGAGGETEAALALSGKLTASTGKDEIRTNHHGWTGDTGSDATVAALIHATEQIVTVSDRTGAFVRVDGTAAVQRAAEDMFRKLPGQEKLPRETRERLARMVVPSVEKDARDNWSAMVGLWAGRELELGEEYEIDGESPVPAVPGERMRFQVRLRVERTVPCSRREVSECLELRFRSVPNAEDLDRIVKTLLTAFAADNVAALVTQLSMVTDVSLVTEPRSLVPHRLQIRKTTAVALGAGKDQPGAQRVDTTTWTYRYRS